MHRHCLSETAMSEAAMSEAAIAEARKVASASPKLCPATVSTESGHQKHWFRTRQFCPHCVLQWHPQIHPKYALGPVIWNEAIMVAPACLTAAAMSKAHKVASALPKLCPATAEIAQHVNTITLNSSWKVSRTSHLE